MFRLGGTKSGKTMIKTKMKVSHGSSLDRLDFDASELPVDDLGKLLDFVRKRFVDGKGGPGGAVRHVQFLDLSIPTFLVISKSKHFPKGLLLMVVTFEEHEEIWDDGPPTGRGRKSFHYSFSNNSIIAFSSSLLST